MPEEKAEAKMELLSMAGELMPKGKPNFLDVIRYPTIQMMVHEHGKKKLMKCIFLLVKDFSNSLNVVRNMNEDQMIEATAMLLDECGNFRLEDYLMMFQMAKKGELVKIYDRLDIQVLTEILDAYWLKRKRAAEGRYEKETAHLDSIGNPSKQIEELHPQDAKLLNATEGLAAAMSSWKDVLNSHEESTKPDMKTLEEKYGQE